MAAVANKTKRQARIEILSERLDKGWQALEVEGYDGEDKGFQTLKWLELLGHYENETDKNNMLPRTRPYTCGMCKVELPVNYKFAFDAYCSLPFCSEDCLKAHMNDLNAAEHQEIYNSVYREP